MVLCTTLVPVQLRSPSGNVFFVASGLLRHLTSATKAAHSVRWTRNKLLALVAGVRREKLRGLIFVEENVSFHELAKRLGISYDTVRRGISKYGDELGIVVKKIKTPGSKGALAQCLSENDANTFIAYIESKPKIEQVGGGGETEISFRRYGYFYIIQVVPELLPNRVKIGYTDNLEQRLREHQTSAPTARIIGYWECKRSWDQSVMDSITRENCSLVMNEVYEGDVDAFIMRAESFFALMPNRSTEIPLADSSPLRQKNDDDHA